MTKRILAAGLLLSLPLVVFFSCLFTGQAFVPADLLSYVAPWTHVSGNPHTAPWNVLRYDGVTQFYPWRQAAARSFHQGKLPFWNAFAFAAAGGTPLWANSQSAPLYPLNYLFYLLPYRLVWYAFGLVAAIQLEIAAVGTWLFARRCLAIGRVPALLAAVTFVLSGPVTCWLALPTFLSVACWIPWLLLTIHSAYNRRDTVGLPIRILAVGLVGGLMILGGHLQIALYGLALGFAFSISRVLISRGSPGFSRQLMLYGLAVIVVLATAIGLALPQLLPSVELSRLSHRASSGAATWDGYQNYVANSLPIRNLVTLLLPNFFGHPNSTEGIYWNTNNYAEWALFTGVTPLLLACFSLGLPWQRQKTTGTTQVWLENRLFFTVAAAFALLIAMGTPLNVPLYFLLPGYSQTGNSGRVLVVFAFSVAMLAALGLEALLDPSATKAAKDRAALIGLALPALVVAFGASRGAAFQREILPGTTLASLLAPMLLSIYIGLSAFVVAAILILAVARRFPQASGRTLVALTAAELLVWGWGYNPSVGPEQIYPVTPGIHYLEENATDADIVAPINRGWSLGGDGPRHAVLPPNSMTVFGLHDASGYDSLFYKTSKDQIRDAGGGLDPSPPENGNMLFIKDPGIAVRLGARFIVTAPDEPLESIPANVRPVYLGDDLLIYENATPTKYNNAIGASYAPASIRIGLFAALGVIAALSATAAASFTSRGIRRRPRRGNRLR